MYSKPKALWHEMRVSRSCESCDSWQVISSCHRVRFLNTRKNCHYLPLLCQWHAIQEYSRYINIYQDKDIYLLTLGIGGKYIFCNTHLYFCRKSPLPHKYLANSLYGSNVSPRQERGSSPESLPYFAIHSKW